MRQRLLHDSTKRTPYVYSRPGTSQHVSIVDLHLGKKAPTRVYSISNLARMGRSVKWYKKYARSQLLHHLVLCTFLCNIQVRNVARHFFLKDISHISPGREQFRVKTPHATKTFDQRLFELMQRKYD